MKKIQARYKNIDIAEETMSIGVEKRPLSVVVRLRPVTPGKDVDIAGLFLPDRSRSQRGVTNGDNNNNDGVEW